MVSWTFYIMFWFSLIQNLSVARVVLGFMTIYNTGPSGHSQNFDVKFRRRISTLFRRRIKKCWNQHRINIEISTTVEISTLKFRCRFNIESMSKMPTGELVEECNRDIVGNYSWLQQISILYHIYGVVLSFFNLFQVWNLHGKLVCPCFIIKWKNLNFYYFNPL